MPAFIFLQKMSSSERDIVVPSQVSGGLSRDVSAPTPAPSPRQSEDLAITEETSLYDVMEQIAEKRTSTFPFAQKPQLPFQNSRFFPNGLEDSSSPKSAIVSPPSVKDRGLSSTQDDSDDSVIPSFRQRLEMRAAAKGVRPASTQPQQGNGHKQLDTDEAKRNQEEERRVGDQIPPRSEARALTESSATFNLTRRLAADTDHPPSPKTAVRAQLRLERRSPHPVHCQPLVAERRPSPVLPLTPRCRQLETLCPCQNWKCWVHHRGDSGSIMRSFFSESAASSQQQISSDHSHSPHSKVERAHSDCSSLGGSSPKGVLEYKPSSFYVPSP
uniref:Uncharacterized protein n=1 Tax=Chromera velia CCMP2878 TaxID=1169474 RepID=A0A0G4IDM2_9ALVE|eukprot:Cvel_2358.t1-p1 / transcript=Cvel_2358.t1 / gene=Cvel_2358 / organism=Chromera_velia_CCMP2878 / gene_product=hypothetical protein / transcript_product=hypothetical protein / location=Cvel_scaffold91:87775-88758(+) / protein_length=328 / sequence_SO=supercontig / SO=protein_coding / is_pseudo=false